MDPQPITLLLPGGAVLGVAFQTGALIALEDVFAGGFRRHVRSIIGSSAGSVTGAFLSIGMTPEMIVKSFAGRFQDEIPYFDPSVLLDFERAHVPSPLRALWRGLLFVLSDFGRRDRARSVADRRALYESHLRRVEAVVDLVPKGWFSLRGLESFLRPLLSGRRSRLLDFDHLRMDLFVCATDLTHGRAVLFGKKKFERRVAHSPFFSKHQYVSGQSLLHAILSSSAIPFLFVPHSLGHEILVDGDTRNTAAVGVAKELVGARLMVTINPLVPLSGVGPHGSASELFLQTLMGSLEGNVVATLKLELEEKAQLERWGGESFDIAYFRPSPEDMAAMTDRSIVNLFRYRALQLLLGYHAVFRTMRDHAAEAERILRSYGHSFDLSLAARRYALLEACRHQPAAVEDALLLSKAELPPASHAHAPAAAPS